METRYLCVMIPCETACLCPLWSGAVLFLWVWINNGVGSYNIDRDKLSTDCRDNRAAVRCVWSFVMCGLNGFPRVNYTPLGWAAVATVHKSSCHAASCSLMFHRGEYAAQGDSRGLRNEKIIGPLILHLRVIDVREEGSGISPVTGTRRGLVLPSEAAREGNVIGGGRAREY